MPGELKTPRTAALHVEQTEPRQSIPLQQALVDILLLKLADLGGGHLAAIGRQFAIDFSANRQHFIIGSHSQQRREQFLFHHGQASFQVF